MTQHISRRRGVAIDPVWVGADTAERRAAA